MHRTFISINESNIQGCVLSENNDIIAITQIEFEMNDSDSWLNKDIFYQYMKQIILQLEQSCIISINKIYVGLHAFIDFNTKINIYENNIRDIVPICESDHAIDFYQTFYINNRNYIFDFDTQLSKYIHILIIYINKLIYEYIYVAYRYQNITVQELKFLPLSIAQIISCNSMVIYLYNKKLVLTIKHNSNINIFNISLHEYKHRHQYNLSNLSYTYGNFENVSYTRQFIHHINNEINQYISQYTTPFNIYLTGQFAYISDIVEYLQFINNNIHTYQFLDNQDYHISENTVIYAGLLNFIQQYK